MEIWTCFSGVISVSEDGNCLELIRSRDFSPVLEVDL